MKLTYLAAAAAEITSISTLIPPSSRIFTPSNTASVYTESTSTPHHDSGAPSTLSANAVLPLTTSTTIPDPTVIGLERRLVSEDPTAAAVGRIHGFPFTFARNHETLSTSPIPTALSSATKDMKSRPGDFFCQDLKDLEDGRMWMDQKDYFELTNENIRNSGVLDCYAAWSRQYRDTPEIAEVGEVSLFAQHFAETKNFRCNFNHEGSCSQGPSLQDLMHKYNRHGPDGKKNWGHIRRVYFMFLMLDHYHQHVRSRVEQVQYVFQSLVSMIPELVKVFTPQESPSARNLCRIRETVMRMFVQHAISFSFSTASYMGAAELNPLIDQTVAEVVRVFSSLGKAVLDSTYQLLTTKLSGLATTQLSNMWSLLSLDIQEIGFIKYMSKPPTAPILDSWINVLANTSPLCSDLEVGAGSNNQDNVDSVRFEAQRLAEFMIDALRINYQKLYFGSFPFETDSNESPLSALLRTIDWKVELGEIKDSETSKELMATSSIKLLVTQLMRNSHGFVMCRQDDTSEGLFKEDGILEVDVTKHNDYTDALFRGPPRYGPLTCVGARVNIDNTGNTRLSYLPGRPLRGTDDPASTLGSFRSLYHWDWATIMDESFESYDQHHNKDFLRLDEQGNLIPRGFQVPICIHPHLRLRDFTVKDHFHQYNAFPMVCGHNANETGYFLKSINIIPGRKDQLDIFYDRLPRSIGGLAPYEYFMNLCNIGVTWSSQTNHQLGINQTHPDCTLVKSATSDMTPIFANEWLCFSEKGIEILQNERGYFDYGRRLDDCKRYWGNTRPDIAQSVNIQPNPQLSPEAAKLQEQTLKDNEFRYHGSWQAFLDRQEKIYWQSEEDILNFVPVE